MASEHPDVTRHRESLAHHAPYPHIPKNANAIHAAEQAAAGFNTKVAVWLTRLVATMWCAYAFAILAILGLPGPHATPTQWVQWVSQTFIQLVMLSVIMVGQSVLGRKAEIQADQQFQTTQKTYADLETALAHLDRQDAVLLETLQAVKALEESNAALQQAIATHVGVTPPTDSGTTL